MNTHDLSAHPYSRPDAVAVRHRTGREPFGPFDEMMFTDPDAAHALAEELGRDWCEEGHDDSLNEYVWYVAVPCAEEVALCE